MIPNRVLVVDDEELITQLLSNYLMLEGYDVDATNNPLQALELVKENKYLAVITDIYMPELNGVDFIKQIKEVDGLIQVIVISGYAKMSDIIRVFRFGASNIVYKPFENLNLFDEELKQIKKRHELILTAIKNAKRVNPEDVE